MQNYFLSQNSHAFIPSSKAIIGNINSLIEKFDSSQLPIIFTKHINDDNNAGMMKNWWNEMITSENKFCDISDSVKYSGHKIINKSQYDAFYNTELEDYLKERNVKQLIVTGVMTHLCCETTIRSSFVRNYEVFFPIDATADYNLDFHKASFLNLSHGFCTPLVTDEIINNMEII
jgi:isochorismate hydrolase